MKAFTHDVESCELTKEEMASYGELAKRALYPDLQERISQWLATISRPQEASICDFTCSQLVHAWRTESRM